MRNVGLVIFARSFRRRQIKRHHLRSLQFAGHILNESAFALDSQKKVSCRLLFFVGDVVFASKTFHFVPNR
jgi:hypothetical protein